MVEKLKIPINYKIVDNDSVQSKLDIRMLDLPDIVVNLDLMKQLIKLNNCHPLFNNDAIEALLTHKWRTYGKTIFLKDTVSMSV